MKEEKQVVSTLLSFLEKGGFLTRIEQNPLIDGKYGVLVDFWRQKEIRETPITALINNELMFEISQQLGHQNFPLILCPHFFIDLRGDKQVCDIFGFRCDCLIPHFYPCPWRFFSEESGRKIKRIFNFPAPLPWQL